MAAINLASGIIAVQEGAPRAYYRNISRTLMTPARVHVRHAARLAM